ncbi:sensor histidine kinase [Qipengyuania mesophila]|uniref:sensor histidine kinase n=1 Tax=Qipengyuania mesophila TaxID=2867246 RepID=UPI0035147372
MQNFVDVWQYMPHGMCLLWQPWLVALWAGSDLLIFVSYTAIPIALLTVLRRRDDIPFSGLVLLFASFILLCGLTHLMGIITLWYPIYPWVGLLKLATGLVSAATAVVLFRLIPTLVALPSPAQLAQVNEDLRREVEAHQATLAGLEDLVSERTEKLHDANAKLAVQTREAVHRSANLLAVVTSLTRQTAQGHERTDQFVETLLGRIHSLAMATSTVMRGENHLSGDLATIIRQQLDPVLLTYGAQVSVEGPSTQIVSEAAQQISLAIHELATNAQKYSLSQDANCRATVTWALEDREEGEMFTLTWRETLPAGHSLAEPVESKAGFGTTLLTRIVPQMLRGTATRSFAGGELTYRLEVPASAVLANPQDTDSAALAARLVDEGFGSE